MDGQTDKVKPVYPPLNFVEAGGIIIIYNFQGSQSSWKNTQNNNNTKTVDVVRSAGTSGGPSRKKKHRLPARSDRASSLEELLQYCKVSTHGSSGLRTISGLCRGRKILQVVPRRVLRTHYLFVINIFVRAFCFCCVLVEFFLLFLSRGCVTTWRHFCFLSAIFLSIYLFFFGTLCLFVIFPV